MKLAPLIIAVLVLCLELPPSRGARGKKPKPKPTKPTFCIGKDQQKYEIGEQYLDTKTCIQYTCVKKKKKLNMAAKKMPKPCLGSETPSAPSTTTTTKPEPTVADARLEAIEKNIQDLKDLMTAMQSTSDKHEINIETNKKRIAENAAAVTVNNETCLAVKITAEHLGTCLADVNSSYCPPSGKEKISMTEAIMENKEKIDGSFCGGPHASSNASITDGTCRDDRCYGRDDRCYEASRVWNCGVQCIDKDTPCNDTCPEGWSLCNQMDFYDENAYYYVDLDYEICKQNSQFWMCDGKCNWKSHPCNGTCDVGYTLCPKYQSYDDNAYGCYIVDSQYYWICDGKCQEIRTPCNGTCAAGYTLCDNECIPIDSWDYQNNHWNCSGQCQGKDKQCNGNCPDGYLTCDGSCGNDSYYNMCLGQCIYQSHDCIDTCLAGNITMEVGESMEINCKMFNCTVEFDNWNNKKYAVLVTTDVTTTECINSE